MGTWERLTMKATCPCGNGSLVREIDSPDYCFGRAYGHPPKIVCSVCAEEWVFRGDFRLIRLNYLTSPLVTATCDLDQLLVSLYQEINAIKTDELKKRFAACEFRYKTEEHRYLVQQGFFEGTYQTYLKNGLATAVRRLSTESVPACAAVLEQLIQIESASFHSRRARDKWFQDNRAALEFIPEWRSV
jgi:hypothetical protein